MLKFIVNIILFIFIPLSIFSQEIGKDAPDFTGYSASGDTIKLSDYKGKVLVLDFWASWCKPCKEEFPFLIELYNKYPNKDFSVLTVNLDDESSKIIKFLSHVSDEVPFKIVFDKESKLPTLYNVDAMPSSFIIDKKGVIRYLNIGFKSDDKSKITNEIEKYLNN
jgi:thiol-disulfide isomerase/thioredoxin